LWISLPSFSQLIRKSEIEFSASDGLMVTADHYYASDEFPYILLFHTELSSRAEYDSLAYRFVKMKYNCLSVDLRSGDRYLFADNKTAKRARSKDMARSLAASEKDIRAAISYVDSLSEQAVVLLGSSASATLVLKVARSHPRVSAVLAFSPGEFLRPRTSLKEIVSNLDKPVFVAGSAEEYPYLTEVFAHMDPGLVTLSEGIEQNPHRGTEMLRPGNPVRDQFWLSLLLFIKTLRN
jgi:dienelactone hydrolase